MITTPEDIEYSESEDIAIQLKKMDKNDPDYEILKEELEELRQREYEDEFGLNYCSMLKKVMR